MDWMRDKYIRSQYVEIQTVRITHPPMIALVGPSSNFVEANFFFKGNGKNIKRERITTLQRKKEREQGNKSIIANRHTKQIT